MEILLRKYMAERKNGNWTLGDIDTFVNERYPNITEIPTPPLKVITDERQTIATEGNAEQVSKLLGEHSCLVVTEGERRKRVYAPSIPNCDGSSIFQIGEKGRLIARGASIDEGAYFIVEGAFSLNFVKQSSEGKDVKVKVLFS